MNKFINNCIRLSVLKNIPTEKWGALFSGGPVYVFSTEDESVPVEVLCYFDKESFPHFVLAPNELAMYAYMGQLINAGGEKSSTRYFYEDSKEMNDKLYDFMNKQLFIKDAFAIVNVKSEIKAKRKTKASTKASVKEEAASEVVLKKEEDAIPASFPLKEREPLKPEKEETKVKEPEEKAEISEAPAASATEKVKPVHRPAKTSRKTKKNEEEVKAPVKSSVKRSDGALHNSKAKKTDSEIKDLFDVFKASGIDADIKSAGRNNMDVYACIRDSVIESSESISFEIRLRMHIQDLGLSEQLYNKLLPYYDMMVGFCKK